MEDWDDKKEGAVVLVFLSGARVRGYRSLRNVDVGFTALTACIGPNGSGKSSLLSAIELFFEPVDGVADLDYWTADDERAEEISIELAFELDPEEANELNVPRDASGIGRVERRFEEPGLGVYLVQRKSVPEFSRLRRQDRGHRDDFNHLVDAGAFPGLTRSTSKADAFEKMAAWEQDHPDRCKLDSEVYEPIEALLAKVTHLSIGAFEDPASHVEAGRGSAISRLLERAVNTEHLGRALDAVAQEAAERSKQVLEGASAGFESFNSSVRGMLDRFAPGCSFSVSWRQPELTSANPHLNVEIQTSDGGQARPLEYQGHGVQRALMYAALTAEATDPATSDDSVLLVIEEPEAFQHPLSCRVLANTLRDLSSRNYQVIYSTHAPFFIYPELIDGLRIFRREGHGGGASTVVDAVDRDSLLEFWRRTFGGTAFTWSSVVARLKVHLQPHVLEGLFAKTCVVVEGSEDEAIVRAAAMRADLDLDAGGVAVIQANGKTSMPNLLALYRLAGIPAYPIFDLDRDKDDGDQHREAEAQILRALSHDETAPSIGVHERYACWEENLTAEIAASLGERYERLLERAANSLGYDRPSRGRKVPAVIERLFEEASTEGLAIPALDEISGRLLGFLDPPGAESG